MDVTQAASIYYQMENGAKKIMTMFAWLWHDGRWSCSQNDRVVKKRTESIESQRHASSAELSQV